MEPITTVAIGIDLDLVPTASGGRQTALLGGHEKEHRFEYRPNWGLPGWPDGEQTAGPVLGFSRTNIQPGERTRAILVPLFPQHVPRWLDVQPSDVLRMYEGSRVCGRGFVRWVESASWPMADSERDRVVDWLSEH